jgi:hypothetical protein
MYPMHPHMNHYFMECPSGRLLPCPTTHPYDQHGIPKTPGCPKNTGKGPKTSCIPNPSPPWQGQQYYEEFSGSKSHSSRCVILQKDGTTPALGVGFRGYSKFISCNLYHNTSYPARVSKRSKIAYCSLWSSYIS